MTSDAAEAVEGWLAEEREAMLERFASSISHAIGTPLQVIHGRAGLIAADADDEEIEASVRIIEAKVGELTDLIHQVLGFARSALGPAERLEVGELVSDLVGRYGALAESRGIALVAEPIAGGATWFAPRDRAQQILAGCVAQGLARGGEGERIVVSAGAADAATPAGYAHGRYTRVEVQWQGVSFDQVAFARALEPWLAESVPDRRGALQLAVSYGLARRLGGWIDAGGGSTETRLAIHLPAEAGEGGA